MHGEDRPNIKTQLIIVALKFAEFPDHISIDYDAIKTRNTLMILIIEMIMIVTWISSLRSGAEGGGGLDHWGRGARAVTYW